MNRPGIGFFARHILGKPLYPYQEQVGDAIIDSVLYGLGNSYTVMMSGQAKQELVARLAPAILLLRPQRGWSMAHRFGAVYGTPDVRGCDFRLL